MSVGCLGISYSAHPMERVVDPAPNPPFGPVIAGRGIQLRPRQPLEAGRVSGPLLFECCFVVVVVENGA